MGHSFVAYSMLFPFPPSVSGARLALLEVWEKTPGFGDSPLLESLWTAIDEAIELKECDLYTYNSDLESDPFGEKGNVWSFNFFFYNKRLKRILYFACRAKSKAAVEVHPPAEIDQPHSKAPSDLLDCPYISGREPGHCLTATALRFPVFDFRLHVSHCLLWPNAHDYDLSAGRVLANRLGVQVQQRRR
mmetsp:Transcript_16572/g.39335  ORF Transcript_16572/g.39335 Transcript_16572/m.39335 type:complete len:189 (+) Transcript_16572:289-855(+)